MIHLDPTRTAPAVTGETPVANTPTPTGLTGTADTLSTSEENTNSVRPCARLKACFSSILNSISTCFSKIYLYFRTLFMNPEQYAAFNDARLVNQIIAKLAAESNEENVNNALELFAQLTRPAAKMEIFDAVLTGMEATDFTTGRQPGLLINTSGEIARQFYAALPVDLQNAFKREIWLANNRQDNGHGFGYGDYVVAHEIRSSVAAAASLALRYALHDTGSIPAVE